MKSNREEGPMRPTITLTYSNYWKELGLLRTIGKIPSDLIHCLQSLVSSHIHSAIPPQATPHLISLAKIYLKEGVMLTDSSGDYLYDVMVYVPYQDKKENRRSFFKLIQKYPDGKLRYLSECS